MNETIPPNPIYANANLFAVWTNRATGQAWNGSAWVTWSEADLIAGATTATANAIGSASFAVPAGVASVVYDVAAYQQAGESPATGDLAMAPIAAGGSTLADLSPASQGAVANIVNPITQRVYYYGPTGADSSDNDGSIGQPWQTLSYACASIYGLTTPALLVPLGADVSSSAPQFALNVFADGYVGVEITSNYEFQISYAEGSSSPGWEPPPVGSIMCIDDRFATVLSATDEGGGVYLITLSIGLDSPTPGEHWFAGLQVYLPNLSGAFNAAPAQVTGINPGTYSISLAGSVASLSNQATPVPANVIQVAGKTAGATAAVNFDQIATIAAAADNTASLPGMIAAGQFTAAALSLAPKSSLTVTPLQANASNPSFATRDLSPLAQGSAPATIWQIDDGQGNPVDLSEKTIRFVVYEEVPGNPPSQCPNLVAMYQYQTGGAGITVGGAGNNQVTVQHIAANLSTAGEFRYWLLNITDSLPLVHGRLPVRPAVWTA